MKTIIVATDFSATALNAADYAADMAVAINADILLLHIYQLPVSYSELAMPLTQDDIMQSAEQNINELRTHLTERTKNKITIDTKVRMAIFFFAELKRLCELIKPYTVIMGSQGTTAAEHLFLGSHTAHAIKHLMWPLITVPVTAAFSTVKKIGFACDLNQVVQTVPLEEINILVNDFNAELHILNIDRNGVFNPDTDFESVLLEGMMRPLKPTYHFITNKNTDEGIMDFAEHNKIDLLIVLPRRHGVLSRLIHKSHTKQLVLHSHVPVMALHYEIL
jgi:nucleotide-binding universal stress UspA family protein